MIKKVNNIDKDEYLKKVIENAKETKEKKVEAKYSIYYINGTDFAIKKETKKITNILHFIHSKQIIVLENVTKNTFEKLEPEILEDKRIDYSTIVKKILSFFSSLRSNDTIIQNGLINFFNEDLKKHDIDALIRVFFEKGYINYLYLKNIKLSERLSYFPYHEELNDLYKYNKKIFEKFYIKIKDTNYSLEAMTHFLIINNVTMDDMNFILNIINYKKYYLYPKINISKYNISLKNFFKYLFVDNKIHHISSSDIVNTYIDYLEMSFNLYGKVKNKYPKYLLTEHNKIKTKLKEKENYKEYEYDFNEVMEEASDLKYISPIEKYEIIVPNKYTDLIEEGENLNHCVASYIKKVVDGDCYVVFLRDRSKKNESLLTIEVLLNNDIVQVEGLNMRRTLSDEENHFINNWAKKKNLNMKATNVVIE